MNVMLTYLVIGSMCFFGTKLKVIGSEFTEVLPGVATADVVTKFTVDIRSNGKKKITIESIWVKNTKAQWKIIDGYNNTIESITDKKTYSLKGEIRAKQGSIKSKTSGPIEASANYTQDFVVTYKVGNTKNVKFLKIDKIEDLKQIRKQ